MNAKKIVGFGDICSEFKVATSNPETEGLKYYVGLEHLDSGSLKIKRYGIISEDKPQFTRVFKKGHILLGKRRPYLKKAAIADFDGICSSDIIVIEPKKELLDSTLLASIIQTQPFWQHAINTSSGSLSPRTKFSSLSTLKLKLGTSSRCEELTKNVKKFLKVIHLNDELLHSAEKNRNIIIQKALKGLTPDSAIYENQQAGPLNKNHKVVRLEELLKNIKNSMRSGPFGSTLKKEDLSDSGTPLLGIDNVFEERFVSNFKRFVPDRLLPKLSKFEVYPGDVMITIMGTVGRACVYPENIGKALSSKHLWTMTFDEYPAELISWQLNNAPWAKRHFTQYSQGGIMESISSQVLKSCPIVVPEADSLNKLNDLVQSSKLVNEHLEKKVNLVRFILDNYLQKEVF